VLAEWVYIDYHRWNHRRKNMIKSTRTDVVITYKSIRNLSACVEKRGELGWMVGCSLGGERWDREEEGEIEKESVGKVGIY